MKRSGEGSSNRPAQLFASAAMAVCILAGGHGASRVRPNIYTNTAIRFLRLETEALQACPLYTSCHVRKREFLLRQQARGVLRGAKPAERGGGWYVRTSRELHKMLRLVLRTTRIVTSLGLAGTPASLERKLNRLLILDERLISVFHDVVPKAQRDRGGLLSPR